uniref:Reverse transcriptase domain-containing protein n=1 Tax=Tanacetum cinerariifolium TaxID=118510 RepID=A0A6L2P0F4_TANCI|nr:reverse transcriptase domain-containing protein [Tanacetum cinerariifolium]
MHTRNSYFPYNSSVTIPRRRNKRRTPNVVEPELCTIVEVAQMADNQTMEELLQAPTEGYGEAIIIPEINAAHFEIKTNLLQLVQANPYHGFERENPHTRINNFKRITSTLKFKDLSNDVIKLMMFPYLLEGAARVVWYDKEPPNSILTWEELVNKFVNQLFPPSKTIHLKNEISRFTQRFEETFGEAWERFKEMLRACPHHKFTELTQIDNFYNSLNENDQDSLNAMAGGNILRKTTREALQIIENKAKVCYLRNKPNVSRMNTTSRENASKTDDRIDVGRSFLRIGRALIDVYREETTLGVNDESITFNLNQTMRYSFTNDDLSVNRIDVIDVAREEYAQEVLEEIEAYLKDESISTEIDHADCDPKGDIYLIEKLLNGDLFQLPSMDLKQGEVVKVKSLIEEPPELELKDLPSHLEYAYLEGADKLPVIIAKDLKYDEKEALLKVLKSHKRAIAWKITDIKGIDPRFCTHKILMEEDYKPTVRSQRWVNPKIHEVIKKEVIKLLDAGMIYPISDSPWVDQAKVDVIAMLPHPTTVKGVRSFLGHAGFYQRFIQDFSKITRPMTQLLKKERSFVFSKDCIDAFETHKKKLTEAPILVVPDWNLPFELMCNASDFAIGVVLGQQKTKHFQPIHYAFRTAYKTPIGCTPYNLVYEKSCHLPIELEHKAYEALKHVNFDLKTASDHWKLQLNEVNELRDQAYENSLIYKEKTKKLHDSKIKNHIFNVGDRVLFFNSHQKIFLGKLKSRWSGPFTITQIFPYGTVELSQPKGPNFKVNGHHVKRYFRGDILQLIVLDLQTFPMDK